MRVGGYDMKFPVLHVVEAYGGGVMVAVNDYIANTSDSVEHIVIAAHRPSYDTGASTDANLLEMGSRKRFSGMVASVNTAIKSFRPAVVHFHSSWAAATIPFVVKRGAKFVYTPHCYAFERTDIPSATRAVFRTAEATFARKLDAVVACSPREAVLAKTLSCHPDVYYVPNVAWVTLLPSPRPSSENLTVATVGRVVTQKGPDWYGAFARHLRGLIPGVRIEWLGGGEPHYEATLRASGVEVSGWIWRNDLLTRLSNSDVYVHAAAWEGAPLSLLEAAAFGLPIYGRRIPALEILGIVHLFDSPQLAAEAIEASWRNAFLQSQRSVSAELAARHTPEAQAAALIAAYRGSAGQRLVSDQPCMADRVPT